jgi:hypothetical protein
MKECCKVSIAKIPQDEPVFCLFGRDKFAPVLINQWIDLCIKNGVNEKKVERGIKHLKDVLEFQHNHPERVHLPD